MAQKKPHQDNTTVARSPYVQSQLSGLAKKPLNCLHGQPQGKCLRCTSPLHCVHGAPANCLKCAQQLLAKGGPRKENDLLPAVRGAGDVSVWIGASMTAEAGLRLVYEHGAKKITDEALLMISKGTSAADAARWATDARNKWKEAIRAKGSPITKALAEARNIKKYGNKIGPSFDELIREGKTPQDIIGSAGKSNLKVNRAATSMKVAGRFFIALDIAIVTWEVLEAPENDRLRTAVGGVGGIAGALAGGWAGAKGGALTGGAVGSLFPGAGTAMGAGIGGVAGGLGGAIGGGWAGRKGSEALFDIAEDIFAPNIDQDMAEIDAAQDALIRRARR